MYIEFYEADLLKPEKVEKTLLYSGMICKIDIILARFSLKNILPEKWFIFRPWCRFRMFLVIDLKEQQYETNYNFFDKDLKMTANQP